MPLNIESLCKIYECTTSVRSKDLCAKHGAYVRKCETERCENASQCDGKCYRHGGKKRCSMQGCRRFARSKGKCMAHSEKVKCKINCCLSNAVTNGKCKKHNRS